jgi:hypothetical protein
LRRSANLTNVSACVDIQPGTACAAADTCLVNCPTRKAYILSGAAVDFPQAQRECSAMRIGAVTKQGTLVAYASYDEQLMVERYFGSRAATGPLKSLPSYWIGLNINTGAWCAAALNDAPPC